MTFTDNLKSTHNIYVLSLFHSKPSHFFAGNFQFTFQNTAVTFHNDTSNIQCSLFEAEDDMLVEGDFNFTVSIGRVSPSDVLIGSPSSVEVTIVDNDCT